MAVHPLTERGGDGAEGTLLLLEQLLATIDEGRRTGTHKLLAMLALMDAAAVSVGEDLRPAAELPVAQVAEQVLRIAWSHAQPFSLDDDAVVLHQMNDGRTNLIVDAAGQARQRADELGARTPEQLARRDPKAYSAAVTRITRELVRNPLARLQTATGDDDFLFASWAPDRSPARLAREQGTNAPVVRWRPGAAPALIRYAPLLRPLVEAAYLRDITAWNGLARVEDAVRRHLFGSSRDVWPPGLKEALYDAQGGRCFYEPTGRRHRLDDLQVDHFLPWRRFHLDGVANLVLATATRNASKSDLFVGRRHVDRWLATMDSRRGLAAELDLDAEASRSLTLARAGYAHLPIGAPLWLTRAPGGGRHVEPLTPALRADLRSALAEAAGSTAASLAAEGDGPWRVTPTEET